MLCTMSVVGPEMRVDLFDPLELCGLQSGSTQRLGGKLRNNTVFDSHGT